MNFLARSQLWRLMRIDNFIKPLWGSKKIAILQKNQKYQHIVLLNNNIVTLHVATSALFSVDFVFIMLFR